MKNCIRRFLAAVLSFVFVLTMFIPSAFAAENKITEVNITLPIPQVGAEIYDHDEIILDNDKCRVGLIGWFSETGGVGNSPQSDVFLPGYNYSLYVTIDRNSDNYVFAEDCVVTVNGEPIEVVHAESGCYVYFMYDFGNSENVPEEILDEPVSLFKIIEGYIKEAFKKIYRFIVALFGIIIY